MCRLCDSTSLVSKLVAIHIFHNFSALRTGVPRFRGAGVPLPHTDAGHASCCSILRRGTGCVAIFALFAGGARRVGPFVCGANVFMDNMGLNGDISTKVTWVSVKVLNHDIQMYLFPIELHRKPVKMLQELKKTWKTIWGTSHTSAASVENILPTKNPFAFTINCMWTANQKPAPTV